MNGATLPEAAEKAPGMTERPELVVASIFTSGLVLIDGIVGSLASRATASRLGLGDFLSLDVS